MDHWMGAVVTFILSPWLSHLTFGNKEYTAAFMWLSVTLLFNQLTSGQDVLLQGMRKLNTWPKPICWSFVGLVISAPLYYYYRIDGIVPLF
jgi:O-antigen/teichoic acid export membrane protein